MNKGLKLRVATACSALLMAGSMVAASASALALNENQSRELTIATVGYYRADRERNRAADELRQLQAERDHLRNRIAAERANAQDFTRVRALELDLANLDGQIAFTQFQVQTFDQRLNVYRETIDALQNRIRMENRGVAVPAMAPVAVPAMAPAAAVAVPVAAPVVPAANA